MSHNQLVSKLHVLSKYITVFVKKFDQLVC